MAERQPVSDPEVLRMLNGPAQPGGGPVRVPVTDPALVQQLNGNAGPSVAADVAKAAPVGVAKGAIGIAGTFGDVQSAYNKIWDRGTNWLVRSIMDATGLGPQKGTPERADLERTLDRFSAVVDAGGGNAPTSRGIQSTAEKATGPFYKPKTMAGEYAQTVGEFAPSALAGSGGMAGRIVGDVLAPAILAESAGQLTKGTAAEPYARLTGGVAGNVGAATVRARSGAPERAVSTATRDVTPEQFDAARDLQNRAVAAGVPLTGPEAIQSTTNNATKLGDIQRVAEGSISGGSRLAQFYAARPDQVDALGRRTLDNIAPQDATPSTLGERAAGAADRAFQAAPEGRALEDAIWRAGPNVAAEAAGQVIQPGLASIQARREGMRNALGDRDFAAAREAPPQVDVSMLDPTVGRADPANVYRYSPGAEGYQPQQVPSRPPRPLSLTGPDQSGMLQTDPRQIVGFIDGELTSAKGSLATTLQAVRRMLFDRGGLDTSVQGLSNVRGEINARINAAMRDGDNASAATLSRLRDQIDDTLQDVPEFAAATRNYRAASEPLAPIENNPPLSQAIARDEFNSRFVTPPENVPPMIERGGPSTARAFNEVAPDEARRAFDGYLTTRILNEVTDARGQVDIDRLALALRDSGDVMAQYPAVAQRLQSIVEAGQNARNARTGPLASVAGARTTQAAGEAVLPSAPLVGGQDELAATIMRMAEQDPATTAGLVRQRVGDQFDRSTGRSISGQDQFGGARFARDIAGTAQQDANLNSVLGALPNGAAAQRSFAEALSILRATGARKPQGSPTEFNRMMAEDIGAVPFAVGTAATAGAGAPRLIGDAVRRAWYGRGTNKLADMFIAPDSVEQIRAAAVQGMATPFADAALRQVLQATSAFDR